jgi:hypothetical protein
MPDVAIVNTTVTTTPTDYTVPGTQEIIVKAVRASIDGSGAASSYLPALQLLDSAGHVMWTAVNTASPVAAGASADVSWFPGLGGPNSGGSSGSTLQDKASIYGDNGTVTLVAGTPKTIGWALAQGDALLDLSTPTAPQIITSGLYCFAVAFGGSGFPAGASLEGELTLQATTSMGVGTAFPRGTNNADHYGYTGMTRFLAAGTVVTLVLTNLDTVNHNGFIHQAFVSLLAT